MGQQSAVDRAAMKQAAEDVDASANIIKGLQTQLEGHKNQVRSMWEGDASMAFETVFARFQEDFRKVLQALEGMHGSLVQTKITYESKEEMSRDAVNKVQALLNNKT